MIEEYRLDIKVRNNLILQLIESRGHKSLLKFCEYEGLGYPVILNIINLKMSPLDTRGRWRPTVLKLCEKLNCFPEEIFTQNQIDCQLETNKFTKKVGEAEMRFALNNQSDVKLVEDQMVFDRLPEAVDVLLDTITPRERLVIEMSYGLGDFGRTHELKEIGKHLDVSAERVRQMRDKALRKLRNPLRSEHIRMEHLPED